MTQECVPLDVAAAWQTALWAQLDALGAGVVICLALLVAILLFK